MLCSSNNNNSSVVTRTITKKHIYISSPALYTTPEPAPIPYTATSDSVSPSPYVVNRKRRDHFHVVPEANNRLHGFQVTKTSTSGGESGDHNGETNLEVGNDGNGDNSLLHCVVETNVRDQSAGDSIVPCCGSNDDFATPMENVVEISRLGDCDNASCATKSMKAMQSQPEFFDADEEFFSDSSISNASPSRSRFSSIEELHAARVHLFDEIERRKRAEDALARMHNHWQSVNSQWRVSGVELSLPATQEDGVDTELDLDDRVEEFCLEVVVARFVSEAVGRGLARAEIQAAADTVLESKNLEISRLRDKLQYYEAVNHEMFQRNQEVVELARKQREVRKRKQRWIWSCIGLSITLGASLLAYSYLPGSSNCSQSTHFADVLPPPDSGSTSASLN